MRVVPTAERLRKLLNYDPSTGAFTRILSCGSARAGSEAGCLREGYVAISVDGLQYQAHRLAWALMTGDQPPPEIDHVNGCRTDNRWENLRAATRSENMANVGAYKNNTSGVRGVSWHARSGRWHAEICVRGARKHIGYFASISDAAQARAIAAKNHFGEFART